MNPHSDGRTAAFLSFYVNRRHPNKETTDRSDLVVIGFPAEAKAEEVRNKLFALQKEYLIDLEDAVKQPNGRVKLNQIFHHAAAGAARGSFWGLLIGLLFMIPLAGVAIGAASGALGWRARRCRDQ